MNNVVGSSRGRRELLERGRAQFEGLQVVCSGRVRAPAKDSGSNGIDDSHVSNNLPIAPRFTYPHRSCSDMSFRKSLHGFRDKAKEKLSKIRDGIDELSLQSDNSDLKSTTSSAAKLFLRTVKEASDAFPPLKSVAGGLCAILDNCEVQSTFVRLVRDAYSSHSERWSTSRR